MVKHLPTGTIRQKSQTYEYRTTLTAPPVPLAGFTLLIGDGVFLINSNAIDNDANKTIKLAVERINSLFSTLSEFAEQGEAMKTVLKDKASSSLSPKSDKYDDAADEVEECIRYLNDTNQQKPVITVKDFGQSTETEPKSLHYFAKAPMCLYSRKPQINLKELNLPDKVKFRITQIEKGEKQLAIIAKKMKAFIDRKPDNLSKLTNLTSQLCRQTLETSKDYENLLLKDYKEFQDNLSEIGPVSYPDYLESFLQLSKTDLLSKATDVISNDSDGTGRDINQKFNDFLDTRKRYSGLLFVLNGNTELEINREFKGRLFIVVEKNVLITSATINNDKTDLTTIASLGHMSLQGPVEASLIPWFTFSSVPELPIKGNLIFSRLNFVKAPPEEVLAGKITYDSKLSGASGQNVDLFKNHQYVHIFPTPVAIDIKRR